MKNVGLCIQYGLSYGNTVLYRSLINKSKLEGDLNIHKGVRLTRENRKGLSEPRAEISISSRFICRLLNNNELMDLRCRSGLAWKEALKDQYMLSKNKVFHTDLVIASESESFLQIHLIP